MLIETITHQNFKPESLPFARPEGVVINFNHSQAFSFGDDMGKFKRSVPPLCACGCGGYVKPGNKFINSHNNRGKHFKEKPPDSDAPLCECIDNCGKRVRWNKKKNDWNKYVKGHNAKGKGNPTYGKDKYKKERVKEAPVCECGICGEKTRWNPCTGRYSRFINGHQNVGKNNTNFNKEYAKEKLKNPPLCKCGCGQSVKWNGKTWNVYIKGHFSKGKNNPNYGKIGERHQSFGKKRLDASEYMLNGGAAHANSFIKNPSTPQIELFKLVKLLYPDAILNHPSSNRSIDIAIPDQMIAIEYDASYWHQDKEADNKRQKELEAIGWRFLRYRDYVPTLNKLEASLQQIRGN